MKKILIILVLCLSGLGAYAQLNKPYFYYKGRDYIVDGKYREAIESLNLLLRVENKEYEGYFLRGVAKYNLDDLGGALADFTKALEENPVYTQAYQYRAITRSRMGLYQEALDDFSNALSIRPSNASTYYSRGVTYFLNREFQKSIDDFSQFLKIEPRQVEGYTSRGTSHLYLKDTVEALKDYDRAIKVNPYWSDAYMRKGLLELMQNDYSSSEKNLSRALKLDTTYSIAYFYRGVARNNTNNLMGALSDFDSSIRHDSTSSIAFYNRAIMLSSIGNIDGAIRDYSKVAQSNPNNVLVFYNRGHLYAQQGEYDKAIEDYTTAIKIYPDFANAYRFRAQLKGLKGDKKGYNKDMQTVENKMREYQSKMSQKTFSAYADTSKQFDKILSFDANFENKDFSSIKGDISKEIKPLPMYRLTINAPDTAFVFNVGRYENRKLASYINECHVEGLELEANTTDYSITAIKQIDSYNGDPQRSGEVLAKAITQSLLNQYSSSMSLLSYLISENSNDPFAYLNRAVVQAEMIEFIASLEGNYQSVNLDVDPAARLKQAKERTYDYSATINDLNKVMQLMPELPHTYYNLANVKLLEGDYPAAIQLYDKAIELFPYMAEAYYNRGVVKFMLGEKQGACMDVSRAGELGVDQAYVLIKRLCQNTKQ